ncbi:MAG: glycosyltransferase family 2 protein [Muribaculaceae bacterium]|nr:glycosyltransferase family 2 protein [Muribaculaceae bacterium]
MTAVIILNWNGERLLAEFLPEVVRTVAPSLGRVIVADNGSTDGSLELLARDFPEVEVWAFDKNYGFAEGYNRAIEMAKDYTNVVLLNSDVAPDAGWLEALTDYMEKHPEVAACQPKLLSYKNPKLFEYAGAAGGHLDRNGYPYCRGRIFATCEEDHGQYDEPEKVSWASGACLMVRRELYLRAGGLDKDFFAHMEEIDLCWRLRLLGYDIAAVPSARVRHLGGGSLPAENPRKTYLNFRNNLLMLHKNLPDATRRQKLFRRRLLDTVAWAKFVATLDFGNAGAVVRAHTDFRKMRGRYTSHPDKDLLESTPESRVNILTSYYLRGKKKYSELMKRQKKS